MNQSPANNIVDLESCDTPQKLLDLFVASCYKNIQTKPLEGTMDRVPQYVTEMLNRKKQLLEELRKLDAAIDILTGKSEPLPLKPPPTPKPPGPIVSWTSEVRRVFFDNDYLTLDGVMEILEKNGLPGFRHHRTRNKVNTALKRMVENYKTLSLTDDGRHYKTELWKNETTRPRTPRRLLQQKPITQHQPSIRDRAYRALKDYGNQIHYVNLMEILKRNGTEIGGKDPKANFTAHLSGDNRFKSLGGGIWTLSEWMTDSVNGGNQ